MIEGESVSDFDLVSQIIDDNHEDLLIGNKKTSQEPEFPPSEPLSKVRDRFLDIKKGTISEKLLSEYRSLLEELIEIIGDIEIKKITKNVLRKYIDTQMKLPINRNKNPKYIMK